MKPHPTSRLLTALILLLTAIPLRAQTTSPAPLSPEDTRRAFLALIDRPRVELAPEVNKQSSAAGIATFHFSYASEASQRVPGILLVKETILAAGKPRPAVIVLHGTGGRKEGELPHLRALAEKDFIAIAIDGRFHGQRGNQADYNAAIAQAFTDGKSHPLYLDTVWDVMRLIDYLQTRPDVDAHRIGLMGISKGGIETWLTAAIDPRVAVAIPCISVQSFAWGLQHDAWHHRVGTVQAGFTAAAKSVGIDKPDAAFVQQFYDHLLPGITTQFDGPQLLPLIAPRPLLVISGEKDPINPLPGLNLCIGTTKPAYAQAGVPDQFQVIVQPNTGHGVTKQADAAAIAWFDKWLNEPAAINPN
jgi:pimeloyl-ACP methyl ester carboxylesterase